MIVLTAGPLFAPPSVIFWAIGDDLHSHVIEDNADTRDALYAVEAKRRDTPALAWEDYFMWVSERSNQGVQWNAFDVLDTTDPVKFLDEVIAKVCGHMKLSPAQRDRAAGVLVGLAAGDALGAPYEFGPPLTGQPVMKAAGLWELGEWTDDTAMALAVAEAAANGAHDPLVVADHFLRWFASHPKDVGIQTRHVLGAAGGDARRVAKEAALFFEANPTRSAGNGSLMRTAPVALAHLGDDEAIIASATAISDLTHADPTCAEACVLWSIAIDRAVREGRDDGIRDGIRLLPADAAAVWEERLAEAEAKAPAEFSKNGWVVQALQGAWSATCRRGEGRAPDQLRTGIEGAVAGGHDADTVGAIAGALLGALFGASAVPLAWKEHLHGWPEANVRDLVAVSQLIVNGATPDPTGWPLAESLGAFYEEKDRPSGVVVPLAEDPGVLIGDFKGLKGDGGKADVVVSLCRVGTSDVPAGAERAEIWLIDSPDATANPNLSFVLADTADFITRKRTEGKTVFVHCVRAERRTPAAAAAYLVRRFGAKPDEALSSVRGQLPSSLPPHTAWVRSLEEIEGPAMKASSPSSKRVGR